MYEHDRWMQTQPVEPDEIPAPLRDAITRATALRAWRRIDEAGGNLALARLNDHEVACLLAILDDREAV